MKPKLPRMMLLAALTVGTVMAQGIPAFHEGGPGTSDPAAAIERRIAYYKALLTLTDAQAAQATTIFTNAAAATATLQTNLTTARTSLREAVKANNTATINTLSTQIGTLTGQITAAQNLADAAFYALLTPAQRTILDTAGNGRGGRGFGR